MPCPNLQNIPIRTEEGRRIRQAFIALKGYQILAADYSQIELRIMAHLSCDAGLLRAFNEGRDVHTATASEVFEVAVAAVEPVRAQICRLMSEAAELSVPLLVETGVGNNWDEAH